MAQSDNIYRERIKGGKVEGGEEKEKKVTGCRAIELRWFVSSLFMARAAAAGGCTLLAVI